MHRGSPYRVRPLVVPSQQVLVVEKPLAGVRLTDFLERSCPGDRLALRRLVTAGRVKVNGLVCLQSQRLRTGDVVMMPAVALPAAKAKPMAPLEVLFESATVLVIDKPPGIATVPDRTGEDAGIHGLLAGLRPDADLRIVHRLDRDTSGCLLLGKGLRAAQHFDEQFRTGAVKKTYTALVQGLPTADSFAIDAWLGPDRKRPGKVVASPEAARGSREAHTDVTVRQRFVQHALLGLQPTTGRSHQLRVHLAFVGHPIVHDRDYGGGELLLSALKSDYKLRRGRIERPLLDRMFLHAERVVFHDVDGTVIEVVAPLPPDLAVALRKLESFDERRR